MKKLIILSLFSIQILSSCVTRPDQTLDKNNQTNRNIIVDKLYNYYSAFRNGNSAQLKDCPPVFLSALSNEFILNVFTGEKALANAALLYSSMTNENDLNRAFINQRIGTVYYKMGNYPESYKYINTAIYEGTKNPELFYYKTLLLYYYKKDYTGAENYLENLDIGQTGPFLNYQDILFLKASLKCEKNDFNNAYSIFMKAKDIDPDRFFIYYDILPYFIRSDNPGILGGYIKDSFKYLTSFSNNNYRLKAYRELITYNRLQNRETLYIPFNLSENYNYSTNLLYFYSKGYPVIEKRKSQNIISPLQEIKKTSRDLVYSPLYEEYVDSENGSTVFLQEGIVKLTNIRLFPYSYSIPVTKLITISNIILLLSPTNRFEVVTNADKQDSTKEYITSNALNEIYRINCPYDYYLDTGMFALENNKTRDFVTFGITTNNQVVVSIFYPVQKKLESYKFSLKRYDSAFVIQDIKGDNNPELILLDDDIYIIGKTNR